MTRLRTKFELAGKKRKVQTASARVVLLADVVLSVLPDVSAFRLQGISHATRCGISAALRPAS